MRNFDHQNFYRELHERFPETWNLVSSHEVSELLCTLASLGQPPAGALQLLPEFCEIVERVDALGDARQSQDFRQMVGNMCWQVLEPMGFRQVRRDVPVFYRQVFRKATTYTLENAAE